ncbi:hypothetical protein [Citrobacter freundii]|uniref:hypothetical protein n=1 Tax=Citrobacter freundii TaxID=546 RepID=UPI003991A388
MAPNNRNALDAATSTTGIMTQLIASYELAIGCECTATLSPICPVRRASFCLEKSMQTTISIHPVLVNRERVQEMLGGISRTTFYRKRKQWEQSGTPFPQEVEEIHPPKGGALFRYVEVIQFCKDKGLLDAHA